MIPNKPEIAPPLWVLTSGEAGMRSQAIGLAERLEIPFSEKKIQRHRWLSFLPASFPQAALASLTPASDRLSPPWPRLLISCGRRSAALSVTIRRLAKGQCFTIHIQNPQCPTHVFDLVIPPSHDGLSGANVIASRLALHGLTKVKLSQAALEFEPKFQHLPRPLIGVLIGGPSGAHDMPLDMMVDYAKSLSLLAGHGFGLFISFSRRTPDKVKRLFENRLSSLQSHHKGGGSLPYTFYDPERETASPNPYQAILGLADYLMVTEDSVSMLSEATTSGKPIYRLALPSTSRRHQDFIRSIEAAGYIRPLPSLEKLAQSLANGQTLPSWHYPSIDETGTIARYIRGLVTLSDISKGID